MSENTTQKNNNKIIAISAGVGLFVVIAASTVFVLLNNDNKNEKNSTASQNTSSVSTSSYSSIAFSNPTRTYKVGTYKATGEYNSPAGKEKIDVTITISGDEIRTLRINGNSANPTSRRYIDAFQQGINEKVVGKKIDEAKITESNINGSSLTLIGFNKAIENIQSQAKV